MNFRRNVISRIHIDTLLTDAGIGKYPLYRHIGNTKTIGYLIGSTTYCQSCCIVNPSTIEVLPVIYRRIGIFVPQEVYCFFSIHYFTPAGCFRCFCHICRKRTVTLSSLPVDILEISVIINHIKSQVIVEFNGDRFSFLTGFSSNQDSTVTTTISIKSGCSSTLQHLNICNIIRIDT